MTRPPVWVAELAARFWELAGDPPPLPRDLTRVLVWLPYLRVVPIPGLTLSRAADHLDRLGLPFTPPGRDRPLRGCLFAYRGSGTIFLDADDDPAERRFTLAHELAHFLRDYEHPRRVAAARLGPAVLEVFDGARSATPAERLAAVFRVVPVGCHVHLLDRDAGGRPATEAEREAEAAADRLTFELLAPFDVVARIPPADLTARLIERFGLPRGPAARYAAAVWPNGPTTLFARPFAKNR